MSLVLEEDVSRWDVVEDSTGYEGSVIGITGEEEDLRSCRSRVKGYASNPVYTNQWEEEGDNSSDLLLGTYRSKIFYGGNKCVVDSGPFSRLKHTLISNPGEEMQFAMRTMLPIHSRETVICRDDDSAAEKSDVIPKILNNPPSATFYSYARAPKKPRKVNLESALVMLFQNGSLQIIFDSGRTMEVPVKLAVKNAWSLDVGILIETKGLPGTQEMKYYTIIHPLNGLQPFNLENASAMLAHTRSKDGLTYLCGRFRKSSVCNTDFNDWHIIKVSDPSGFSSSHSSRIILAFDRIQKVYRVFTYAYAWEIRDGYNPICSHWCRGQNRISDMPDSTQTLFSSNTSGEKCSYLSEISGINCLPVPLSCSTANFPDGLNKSSWSVYITSDNNSSPLIWFLIEKAIPSLDTGKYGLKKIYKRMSLEDAAKLSSVKELLGFKLQNVNPRLGNDICNHEWTPVIRTRVFDAVRIKCTSPDRFDMLMIISGHTMALWTGYNELVPCVAPCLARIAPTFNVENFNNIEDENTEHSLPRFSKKLRIRNSDVLPAKDLNTFRYPNLINNASSGQKEIQLQAINDYRARVFVGEHNPRVVDICLDMRIGNTLVKSCFEIIDMLGTVQSNLFAKDIYRRYLLMRFGDHSNTLTEWEDYLAAFISMTYDFGYTMALDSGVNVSHDAEKSLPGMSEVGKCFLNNRYSGGDVESILLGSKCLPSMKRLENIRDKAVGISSNKSSSYEARLSTESFLKALDELRPYFHHLHQAFRIRTFDRSHFMLLSEFATLVSYTLNRPDLVNYYSTASNTTFPFKVFKQDTLPPQPLNVYKRPIDIFDWACNVIGASDTREIEKIPKMDYPNSLWLDSAIHPAEQAAILGSGVPKIPEKLKHFYKICTLLNMKNLLIEHPDTADTLFRLLKDNVIANKLGTHHPGLAHFVTCIKEQLKTMKLEPDDHSLYSIIGREDLAFNKLILQNKLSIGELLPRINTEKERESSKKMLTSRGYATDGTDDEIYPLVISEVAQAMFPKDKRIYEVRKILQSSHPAYLTSMDISDIKFTMEGDSEWPIDQGHLSVLLRLAQRTLALPVGRAAFTLGTVMPISVKKIPIPTLVVSANLPPTNTPVVLESSKTDKGFFYWPRFHNGVAAGLSISPDWKTLDSSWIVYNRDTNQQIEAECLESQHAGFLFGLGLTGRLKMMDIVDLVEYMNNNEGFIAVGLIIGLAASYISTRDEKLTRLCNLHIEPNVPKQFDASCENLIKPSAVISLGLLYMEFPERSHITAVLNLLNSSIKFDQTDITEAQRNSLTLSCGLSLGYMLLGKMGSRESKCVSDMNITDILLEYASKSSIGSIASLGSLLALGLMYLKTNNEIVAGRMNLLSRNIINANSHKDVMLYTVLCRSLIMWDKVKPTIDWVQSNVPREHRRHLSEIVENTKNDNTGIHYNDTVLYIISGACLAIGITRAGSYDPEARATLLYYLKILVRLHYLKAMTPTEGLKKAASKACLNVLLNASSLVSAGSGDVELMRIMRKLHFRRFQEIGYGDQLALHLSLGFLFLGEGTCTFKTTNRGIAGLVTSSFAIYPDSTTDNFIHLQPLRHLWALSAENRCLVTRDISSGDMCSSDVEVHLGLSQGRSHMSLKTPCIIPETDKISHLKITGPHIWPITIDSGSIPPYKWDSRLECTTVFVKCIIEGWRGEKVRSLGKAFCSILNIYPYFQNFISNYN